MKLLCFDGIRQGDASFRSWRSEESFPGETYALSILTVSGS
jgi:hypothetical protein